MTNTNNSYSPRTNSECSDRSSKSESTGPVRSRHSSKKSNSKRSETPNEPNQSQRSVSRSPSRPSRKSVSRSPSRQFRRSVSRSPPRNQNRGRDNRPVANPSECVGVFGLSRRTNDDDLYETFEKFGKINSVKLIMDRYHNECLGYGFINFDDLESAKRAVKEVSGMNLDGRQIRVDFSITKKAHTPTPGGYKGRKREDRNENRNNDNRRSRNYNRNDQCDRYDRNYKNDSYDRNDRNDQYERNNRNGRNDSYDQRDRNDRYDNRKNKGRRRDFSDRSRSRSSKRMRPSTKYN